MNCDRIFQKVIDLSLYNFQARREKKVTLNKKMNKMTMNDNMGGYLRIKKYKLHNQGAKAGPARPPDRHKRTTKIHNIYLYSDDTRSFQVSLSCINYFFLIN